MWFTIRFLVKILPMWQQVIEHNVASVCNSLGDYNQVKEPFDKALMLFREHSEIIPWRGKWRVSKPVNSPGCQLAYYTVVYQKQDLHCVIAGGEETKVSDNRREARGRELVPNLSPLIRVWPLNLATSKWRACYQANFISSTTLLNSTHPLL